MERRLTRRDFLKAASSGMVAASLLGASRCGYDRLGPPSMNIVLIILDSLRRDHVDAYGNGWIKTPSYKEDSR